MGLEEGTGTVVTDLIVFLFVDIRTFERAAFGMEDVCEYHVLAGLLFEFLFECGGALDDCGDMCWWKGVVVCAVVMGCNLRGVTG